MQQVTDKLEHLDFDFDSIFDFNETNQKCVNFIRKHTTIDCKTDSDEDGTFWDGIFTYGNEMIVNLEMAHPGDLLHEAGHLATMLLKDRKFISHDMDFMPKLHELVLNTGMPYGSDDAATGWAYAACQHLEIPTTMPFENGYENEEMLHAICQSPLSRFGYPLRKLGMLQFSQTKWRIIAWDINLLNNP
jgi:hypothetical protein